MEWEREQAVPCLRLNDARMQRLDHRRTRAALSPSLPLVEMRQGGQGRRPQRKPEFAHSLTEMKVETSLVFYKATECLDRMMFEEKEMGS